MPQPLRAANDAREKLDLEIRLTPKGRLIFNLRDPNGDLVATSRKRRKLSDVSQPLRKANDSRTELFYDIRRQGDFIYFNIRNANGRLVFESAKVDITIGQPEPEVTGGVLADVTDADILLKQAAPK
jgi:hypothetical protein